MKKFFLVSVILLSTSCSIASSDLDLIGANSEVSTISSFEPSLLDNKVLASFNGENLVLSLNNKTSFKSEKDAVNYAISQNSALFGKKSFSIMNNGANYYIYEIKSNESIKTYSDLRSIKLNKQSSGNLTAIVSEKSKIRFYAYQEKNNYTNKVNSPKEVIERLKAMENEFSKTKDQRGIFIATYRVISERVDKEITRFKTENKPKSATFLQNLMINFANKYFYAHDLYFSNKLEKTPEVWKMAFDSGRKSQNVNLYNSASIAEILALSMNAHIIHDLSFSLKEVNYDPKDAEIRDVYLMFNKALFEEKDHIISAIHKIYGNNVVEGASTFFGSVGDFTMQKIFTIMRNISESQAELSNKEKIVTKAVSIGDGIMKVVPGGNSI